MHGNESFTGVYSLSGRQVSAMQTFLNGASDLDYAQPPLRWLAPLDVTVH
jgi:hypothetical protein